MRRDPLSRYERSDAGGILIDVAATRAEDLYNDFDRTAPYVRRDLDQDLVDYLIGCAREVGAKPFAIRFTLGQTPQEDKASRIRQSVKSFFLYLAGLEQKKVRQMFIRSAAFLGIGLVVLFASVLLRQSLAANRSAVIDVLTEGLTIAAWVSLWEAVATLLIEWLPRRRQILLFRGLAQAQVVFRAEADRRPTAPSSPTPSRP